MTRNHALDQIGLRDAIRVDHQAKRRASRSHSGVSRRAGKCSTFQMNEAHGREFAGDDLRGLIIRAVNDHNFVVNSRALFKDRGQATANVALGVVARDDDGYDRLV